MTLQHPHAREEPVEIGGDDILERDEDPRLRRHEPAEQRRDLDPREVDQVRIGVLDTDRQVERQVRDVRERVARIDRERGQHREDPRAEHGLQHPALGSSSSVQRRMWIPSAASNGASSR